MVPVVPKVLMGFTSTTMMKDVVFIAVQHPMVTAVFRLPPKNMFMATGQ